LLCSYHACLENKTIPPALMRIIGWSKPIKLEIIDLYSNYITLGSIFQQNKITKYLFRFFSFLPIFSKYFKIYYVYYAVDKLKKSNTIKAIK
jgi:hypothetical protein